MLKRIKKLYTDFRAKAVLDKTYKSVLLLLFFISVFFFILEYREPYFFLWSDNANQFLSYYVNNWNSLIVQHQIPFVNFHQFSGQTYLAQGQSGVLYPLGYLGVMISKLISDDIFLTIDALAYIHLVMAGLAFFFLLREFKITGKLGILGALLWVTLPFSVLLAKSWIATSFFAAFLPLNFLFLERLIKSHRTKDMLWLSVVKALIFFQGNIQWLAVLFILEWLFILLKFIFGYNFRKKLSALKTERENCWQFFSRYFISLVFFGILIFPLFVSVFYAQSISALRSQKLTLFEALSNSLSMDVFLRAQYFRFRQYYIFASGSQLFFMGPIIFATILFNFKSLVKRKKIIIYFITGCFALIISTKASEIFYHLGLGYFRWSFRYFIFFAFFLELVFLMILSGFQAIRRKWAYLFVLVAIILNVVVIFRMSNNSAIEKFQVAQTYNKNEVKRVDDILNQKPGKIFTLWTRRVDPRKYYKFYSHDYATLFDKYHFGGYDALVSKINDKVSLHLNRTNTFEGPLSRDVLDYLSSWGVRYFITQNNRESKEGLRKFAQLQVRSENQDIALYENALARPLVYSKEGGNDIRFTQGVNNVIAYLDSSDSGIIVFNFVSIPGFYYSINGGEFEKIDSGDKPMEIVYPKNTNKIEVKYIDKNFFWALLCSFVLGSGLLVLVCIFKF
jgi:hypothetical protein